MNESNSVEGIDKTNLKQQTKFWLDEISKIENYFTEEFYWLIKENHTVKNYVIVVLLSKYVTVFDYIDQALIVLSAASGGVSIISFTSIAGPPVGIASASLTLFFSLATGIVKKLLNVTRNKKKKQDEVLMLTKTKFSSIETYVSQALIDMEISHEEFIIVLKETDKYDKMKDNWRSENEKKNYDIQ